MRRWSVIRRAARGWAAAVAAVVLLTVVCACTAVAEAPRASSGTPATRDRPVLDSPTPTAAPPPAVVVLDPGHNGGNAAASAEIARPVPAGGFTKPCNTTGTATIDGYAEH